MKIKVRPANESAEDRDTLISMFYELMRYHKELGVKTDLACITHNAELLYDAQFLPGLRSNDPVLIAEDERSKLPVGILIWVEVKVDYLLSDRMACGWGTYVVPVMRNKGVGTMLRKEGLRILKKKGIKEVRGIVHNGNHTYMARDLHDTFEAIGICYRITTT